MNENEDQAPHMSEDELVSICMSEAANALNGDGDNSDISIALDYFNAKLPGMPAKCDPKASTTVSTDVRDAILSTIAQIMPAFTGDMLCRFEPENEQDEQQVRMETDLVNYVFMEQCDGLSIINEGLFDALLNRVGSAKVFWDQRQIVTYQEFKNVPAMALPQVMQPQNPEESVEIAEQEEVEPPEEMMQQYQMQMQQYEQMIPQALLTGQPMPPPPEMPTVFNIKVRRVNIKSQPAVCSTPPEEVLVSTDQTNINLDDCRFVCHKTIETASSLIEQGYDKDVVEELNGYASDNIAGLSRSRSNEIDYNSQHDSTKHIEVYECYPLIDYDGDGIAERLKAVIASNRLLSVENYDGMPIKSGTGILMPHKWQGISLFDRLKEIQDGSTRMMRVIEDGTALAARTRVGAVDNMVNISDLLDSTTGGVIRMRDPNGVVGIPNPEVPQSAYTYLDRQDKRRREAGGSAADNAAQNIASGGDGANAFERAMSAMELDEAQLARTFANTFIKPIYLELHRLIRKFYQGEISAKIGDRWVSSVPAQWPDRERVTVTIGASQGERLRKAGALNNLYQTQVAMMQTGSTLVNQNTIYQTVSDMTSMLGLDNPEQYFVDPNSQEGQQAAQMQQQNNQQMQQKQEQMEQMQLQMQQATVQAQVTVSQAEMAKAQVTAQNNQLKHQIDQLKQQLDQAKAGADTMLEREQMDRDTALKLLEMENAANKDLNAEYEMNKAIA